MANRIHSLSVYGTIFDADYLPQALALHASLMRVNATARFAFFCVDEQSAELLDKIAPERSVVVRHDHFSTPELARTRAHRSRGEYCWTCKPIALDYLARTMIDADWLVYVDADMMFFSDPDLVLPGQGKHYVLTPHRFHKAFKQYASSVGDFNAGYAAVRRSPEGQQVIDWWGARCIESCSITPTGTTFADQKYLDQLPVLFPFGDVAPSPGLNAAPWNIESHRIHERDGRVYLGEYPLVLYHFQGLKMLSNRLVDLYAGNRRISTVLRRLVYELYLEQLAISYQRLQQSCPEFAPGMAGGPRGLSDWLKLGMEFIRGYHNFVRYLVSDNSLGR